MSILTPMAIARMRSHLPLAAAIRSSALTAQSTTASSYPSLSKPNVSLRLASTKLDFPAEGRLRRVFKFLNRGKPFKSDMSSAGAFLMNSCTNEVDVLDFIEVLDLPDTYYSWFLVSELHLWMVSVRLMSEGCKDCQEVRNWMVKTFWEDCDVRAKEVGEKNTAERAEAIAEIGEQFNAALFIYDEGVLGDDIALANAIWRRLLMCRPDPDAEKLEMLVRYVRRTLSLLDNLSLNKIVVENDFKWVPLND